MVPPNTRVAIVLAAGVGARFDGPGPKLRADLLGKPLLRWTLDAIAESGLERTIVVAAEDDLTDLLDPARETLVMNPDPSQGLASSLHIGLQAALEIGDDAPVIGMGDAPLVSAAVWRAVHATDATPIAAARFGHAIRPPTRLAAPIWPELPTSGDVGARRLIESRPELVTEVLVGGRSEDVDTIADLEVVEQLALDHLAVAQLLGREPMGEFEVVVRAESGAPVVIRNHPVLYDGTPMPTRYWLCGETETMLVGRLESLGGVKRAERDIGLDAIAEIHASYEQERSLALDGSPWHRGHEPSGGVGGTRTGVKCLHAHYAHWLAGGDDSVGRWVRDHLGEVNSPNWPIGTST